MTLEERRKRMKEAGIPLPITNPLNEGSVSAIPVTSQNADKHARLQALKSGANRNQVQSLVKANGSQGNAGFQGIPEPKMRKNPNHPGNQLSDPSMAVKPQDNFGPVTPINSELSAIESMFDGSSSPAYNPAPMNQNHNQNITQPDLQVQQDGYGPTFDPIGMLAKKRQQVKGNQYMQFAQQETVQQALAPLQEMSEQQNFDFQNMKSMMEQIAKNTISEVLNSYTEKNKNKLTYENVDVKTSDGAQVIKTQDGKYYKLVPVKFTKKS